jgi:hypothetical protein
VKQVQKKNVDLCVCGSHHVASEEDSTIWSFSKGQAGETKLKDMYQEPQYIKYVKYLNI